MKHLKTYMNHLTSTIAIDEGDPLHRAAQAAAYQADSALSQYADRCRDAARRLLACAAEAEDPTTTNLRAHLPDFDALTEARSKVTSDLTLGVLIQLLTEEG